MKLWRRADVELHGLWEGKGAVWEVVAICDHPTVTLRRVGPYGPTKLHQGDAAETHAIPSPNFAEFKRLLPEEASA